MKTILGVNFKMYFDKDATEKWLLSVKELLKGLPISESEIFILPPTPLISFSENLLQGTRIKIGAQNIAEEESGSFTGENSAVVMRQLHCDYALIGHHERRSIFGENEHVLRRKIIAATRNRLTPILCVGESSQDGALKAKAEVDHQLLSSLKDLSGLSRLIIAYEPVWAIGAEKPATSEHINEIVAGIRKTLELLSIQDFSVIYGGTADLGLFSTISGTCDGLFLGRRAHDPSKFIEIVRECLSFTH